MDAKSPDPAWIKVCRKFLLSQNRVLKDTDQVKTPPCRQTDQTVYAIYVICHYCIL